MNTSLGLFSMGKLFLCVNLLLSNQVFLHITSLPGLFKKNCFVARKTIIFLFSFTFLTFSAQEALVLRQVNGWSAFDLRRDLNINQLENTVNKVLKLNQWLVNFGVKKTGTFYLSLLFIVAFS
jgi:hypothetical protein